MLFHVLELRFHEISRFGMFPARYFPHNLSTRYITNQYINMSIQPSYSYTQEDMEWMEGLYDDCETTDATKCDVDFTEKLQLFVDESDEHDETDEHMGEPPLLEDEVSLAAEANDSTESPSFFESEELLSDDVSVPPVDDDVSVQSILDRYESQSTPNEEEWFKEVTPPHNHISIEIGWASATRFSCDS